MRTKEPKQMDIDFSNKDQLKQLAIKHLEETHHCDFIENPTFIEGRSIENESIKSIEILFKDSLGKIIINLDLKPNDKAFLKFRDPLQLSPNTSLIFIEDLDSILRLYYLGDKND